MGSAYDHLSREQLLALLTSQSEPAPAPTQIRSDVAPIASGDRYREMVQAAADGIFLADAEGIYLDVNEVGARMLGMTREEVIGKHVSQMVVESDLPALSTAWPKIGADDWQLREWTFRRKDGSLFIGEVSSKPLPNGGVQGILRDVTRRRQQEDALKQSEERFRALTAATFEGIGMCERGMLVELNDQLARILGYERSELIGKPVSMMVAPESVDFVAAAMNAGRETPYRHMALRKDGSRIAVEAQGKVAEWAGRTVRVTAIRDVTEQLRLEERLNRVQKLEALGRLAGGIAHDFNNILVAIFSYADLADLDAEEPEQVRAHMEGLRAAARRARDLVLQILSFSRQKADDRTPTPVQPVVEEALKFLRSSLPSTIEVTTEIDQKTPIVLGASIQLHQVVMNLCVNAAHAMHGTGKLTVRLGRALVTPELRERVPELSTAKGYAVLTVEDTGGGMDQETLSRIFEPFFTTKSSGEGSGLGLAVVHGIVKGHDGVIAVESAVGRGTRFQVYLPALESPSSPPPST
jgi:PAS domain S-box-containing protein